MYQYKYIFFISLFFFLFASITHAQNTNNNADQIAKKYNLSFPIEQLGNCTSIASCKAYCDDTTHQEECTAFAKQKGFYKETRKTTSTTLMQSAQVELGCTSESSCRSFCEEQINREKCQSFAKTHKLIKTETHINSQEILQKAKTLLGCDSQSTCKTICSDSANREKCSAFAKQTGLPGGIKRTGPGGCDSQDSCRTYCQSHEQECTQYGKGIQENTQGEQPQQQNTATKRQMINTICKNNPRLCARDEEKRSSNSAETFDAPPTQINLPQRTTSNVNQQSDFQNTAPTTQQIQYQQPQQIQQYQQPQILPSPLPTISQQQKEPIQEDQLQPVSIREWVEGASTQITLWDTILRFFHL